MDLPAFLLKTIALLQALVSFLTSGVFWSEVTIPSNPVIIPSPQNGAILDLDRFR